MHEIGIVKSIDGLNARVMIKREGGPCDSCTQDSCTIPEKGIETDALNAAGAKVGQKVKVEMKSYVYYRGALLIYVIPVIALIAGAVLGSIYLPLFFEVKNTEMHAVIGGFASFAVSLLAVKFILGKMSKKSAYQSVINSILEG